VIRLATFWATLHEESVHRVWGDLDVPFGIANAHQGFYSSASREEGRRLRREFCWLSSRQGGEDISLGEHGKFRRGEDAAGMRPNDSFGVFVEIHGAECVRFISLQGVLPTMAGKSSTGKYRPAIGSRRAHQNTCRSISTRGRSAVQQPIAAIFGRKVGVSSNMVDRFSGRLMRMAISAASHCYLPKRRATV